jgi:hypothetical protein
MSIAVPFRAARYMTATILAAVTARQAGLNRGQPVTSDYFE